MTTTLTILLAVYGGPFALAVLLYGAEALHDRITAARVEARIDSLREETDA